MNNEYYKFLSPFEKLIYKTRFYQHYKYKTALYNLVKRDFLVKYRRSILGIFWSVLNPLLMMIVISAVFSYIFEVSVDNYPVYYLTGFILFNMFSASTNSAILSLVQSAGLIKKMYIPKYLFPLERCLFETLNTSVSIIALIIVIAWFKIPPKVSWLLIPLPFLYLFIFSFGISLILSVINVYFRDIGHLYNVFLKVLIYATPVFYPVSILSPKLQYLMQFNPLYHFIDYFRVIILDGKIPSLYTNLDCLFWSLGSLIFGIIIFSALKRRIVLYI